MSAKLASRLKIAKKAKPKINIGNTLQQMIPAGMASPGPPLGPMLGQRGLNIAQFCKDFNEKTSHIKLGVPISMFMTINPDRSFNMFLNTPPATYFIMQAAGISRGSMSGEIVGKITLKHIYEIAKIKSQDYTLKLTSLEEVCQLLIKSAKSIGVEVVISYDPKEYEQFLLKRKEIVEEQLKELQEKKEAKMLRAI